MYVDVSDFKQAMTYWFTRCNIELHWLTIVWYPVARRKTLFDDRPVEIAELTYVIKQDLSSLNSQISSLQSLSKSQHAQATRSSNIDQEGEHNKNVRSLVGIH